MKRNGKVDFLRFVFALFIMFLHYGYRAEFSIFGNTLYLGQNGAFGVRFFFILSGYLLALSVERISQKDRECQTRPNIGTLTKDNISFLLRKYSSYIKWYLPAFFLCVLLDCFQVGITAALKGTLCSIQNILLLGSLGFSFDGASIGYYVGASWFLSALFLAQIILFPIMRYQYRLWSRVISPIVFIILLALDVNGYGNRVTYAIYCMILGGVCYEIVKVLSKRSYKGWFCNLLRVIEFGIYLMCIAFMCSQAVEDAVYGMMFLVAFAIILSFLPQTQYGFFKHPIFSFLGKVSFPLYLLHIQVLHWADYFLVLLHKNPPDYVKYPVLYLCAILISIGFYLLFEWLGKIDWKKKWHWLIDGGTT